jgi:aminoglycoside phosphotransferase (APT) family kinase protein
LNPDEVPRAVAACTDTATAHGLRVDDAVVLHDSNRLAVRLQPCGVLARVAHEHSAPGAAFEVRLAKALAAARCPIALLDPRVEPDTHLRDGFVVTLWTFYEPIPPDIAPAEHADALLQLHAAMRHVDLPTPHFTDRVREAQAIVDDRLVSVGRDDADRELLSRALRDLSRSILDRGAPEQLLHGEPHPGNVLRTSEGLLFVDLETLCRGPVEFDIVHAPEEIASHYPNADPDLLRECRLLMLAMITAWRWEPHDQLPDGQRLGAEWLEQLRFGLDG